MAWTDRYCSPTGGGAHDGTTAADAWTLAEAITNVAAGHRVNVIAGTYANTTTSRTFATAGTTTAPIWWRGYKTTIGDMDTAPTSSRVAGTDIPSFTFTTGLMVISASHQTFSAIDIDGAATAGGQLQFTGASLLGIEMHRVRVRNTGTNAASAAVLHNNSQQMDWFECWFNSTTTANYIYDQANGSNSAASFHGCVFRGGKTSIRGGAQGGVIRYCTFDGPSTFAFEQAVAISLPGNMLLIANNSFSGCGSDAIRISAVPTSGRIVIADNVFNLSGGYNINNSTASATNFVKRHRNLSYSATSGHENGFGDAPDWDGNTDSASSFTNASGHDLSLVTGSNGKGTGTPGLYENESYTSYLDRGSVQRQEASTSGGMMVPTAVWGTHGVNVGA